MLLRFIQSLILFAAATHAAAEPSIVTAVIPPYTYLELNKPQGLITGIIQAMAKHTGHSGDIKFLPWKRALQMAETSPADKPVLIIPLNRSPEREDRFQWIQELYRDETVFVTKGAAGESKRLDIEQAKKMKIGVLLGSPLEAQLKLLGFENIEPAVNEETNARKLHFGRIDAWHVAKLVAPFVFERNGFNPRELQYGSNLDVNDLYLGASKKFPAEEAKKWRDAYQKIKEDGTLAALVKRFSY